ncbi:MAG TPA: plastocyanin/azurin family copper-binding protein, partial [Acidimicrobiales bacterium]|nr:plastocyanin/azurin family copper-binding protein [Acidimicrobiales bacterium]
MTCLLVAALAPGTAAAATVDVSVIDNDFVPPTVTISAGDTVRWTNNGSDHHTVTASNGAFDGHLFANGDTFTHTFATAGQFPYVCEIHPGMDGVVVVQGSGTTTTTVPPTTTTVPPTTTTV